MAETARVSLLHGSDEFAIAEFIEKACRGLGDPATADMNITRLDGRAGVTFEALNTAVNAAPFLAPRRVVVLLHPTAAFPPGDNRKKFLELLEKAQPTTSILLAEFEPLDQDKKKENWLLKWAGSNKAPVEVHAYNMPRQWEMPRWIESEVKKQAKGLASKSKEYVGKIDPDAAALLAEMTGEETRVASQEIAKLLTYVKDERPITLADVEKVSIVSAPGKVFDFVDALGMGEAKKAQHILQQLFENEDLYYLWSMIIRQFRLLLQARELLDANANSAEIQKRLGLHPYVVQKVTNQARRFSIQLLEKIYHKLLDIDEADKIQRLPPEERPRTPVPLDLALDTLVVELTRA